MNVDEKIEKDYRMLVTANERFEKKLKIHQSKAKTIILTFLAIIVLGTALLMLPISSADGSRTDFLTSLFTATSATCVTGLVRVDTCLHWSLFGKIVILTMIQIGGLGTVTMGILLAVFLRRNITLKSRSVLMDSVNSLQLGGVIKLVKGALFGTLFCEMSGAVALMFYFIPRLGVSKGIGYGIFHAISAFCNAGFDLMGYTGAYSSFTSAVGDPLVNIVFYLLIIIGGLGFAVWADIAKNGLKFKKYRFHSKIVLTTSLILLVIPSVLFFIYDSNGVLAGMTTGEKVLASVFSSVTARTAGFNTVDTGALSTASKMLTMMLMFVGGSPGSTAGGIKTTTIAVVVIYAWSYIRGEKGANAFHRCISGDTIKKAITLFSLNLMLALISVLVICSVDPLPLEDIMFEVFSAIGTVGMTTGITRDLSAVSAIVIIILMFLGRLGSMTIAFSFTEGRKVPAVKLPDEELPIG